MYDDDVLISFNDLCKTCVNVDFEDDGNVADLISHTFLKSSSSMDKLDLNIQIHFHFLSVDLDCCTGKEQFSHTYIVECIQILEAIIQRPTMLM